MKRYFVLAIVIALLSFISPVFAGVAVDDNDGYVGEATNISIQGQSVTFDGSKVTVLANGHKAGVTDNVSGESNLLAAALAYGYIRIADSGPMPATATYLNYIADGTPGQMVTIQLVLDTTGAYVITDDGVNPADQRNTGWDDIAFDTAGDSITLLYIDDTYGWIIVGNNGCTVTQ